MGDKWLALQYHNKYRKLNSISYNINEDIHINITIFSKFMWSLSSGLKTNMYIYTFQTNLT